jgi:RNA polymerase sigma-70 factor (ECF subfamily)
MEGKMNQVAQQIEVHVPALMRYARALAHNPTAAEDLVQECVVRALTKASLYKPGTNLRAWLFTILHNLYISDMRRNKKWKEAANPEAALNALSVAPRQTHAVMLRAVREAMRRLPSQQKMILYFIGVEGKSYKEVSRELGIPVGTVKSRCSRARDSLQQELDNRTVSIPHAA